MPNPLSSPHTYVFHRKRLLRRRRLELHFVMLPARAIFTRNGPLSPFSCPIISVPTLCTCSIQYRLTRSIDPDGVVLFVLSILRPIRTGGSRWISHYWSFVDVLRRRQPRATAALVWCDSGNYLHRIRAYGCRKERDGSLRPAGMMLLS